MSMNKSKGNMYPWVTHTWNPIGGRCPYECEFCYMKDIWNRFGLNKLEFREHFLKDDLGKGNTIFVGSSTDMFSLGVPSRWIHEVLDYISNFTENTYLFQTKNPERFIEFWNLYPKNCIFGTTIESNRDYDISKAPPVSERYEKIRKLQNTMVSIEPILDFDLDTFVTMIRNIEPEFVSIGADSKNHNLPEPSKEKIELLIEGLKEFTEVKIKDNLNRLMSVTNDN